MKASLRFVLTFCCLMSAVANAGQPGGANPSSGPLGQTTTGQNVAIPLEILRALVKEKGIPAWMRNADEARRARARGEQIAGYREYWNNLASRDDTKGGLPPLANIRRPANQAEYMALTDWVRWKVLVENADGRYSYAYADLLTEMNNENGPMLKYAATYYVHARISLAIDAARCRDKHAWGRIVYMYDSQPRAMAIALYLKQLPNGEKRAVLLEAVALEEMRGERSPIRWACLSDPDAIRQATRHGVSDSIPPVSSGESASPGKRQLIIDMSRVEPVYISEEQWRRERKKILESVINQAARTL